MTEQPTSNFQVTIVASKSAPLTSLDNESPFSINQHSRGSAAVLNGVERLEEIWEQVIAKLSGLAAQSHATAAESGFELTEIEFHVGIEAGLSVGLVTKGDASVGIKFAKKKGDG